MAGWVLSAALGEGTEAIEVILVSDGSPDNSAGDGGDAAHRQQRGAPPPCADGQSNYNLRRLIRLWLNLATSFSLTPPRLAALAGA